MSNDKGNINIVGGNEGLNDKRGGNEILIKSFDDVNFKKFNKDENEIEEDIETNADFTIDDLKI